MFCPFLENREEEKMINKLVANKGADRGGTGPDVKLHSGARTEKSIC